MEHMEIADHTGVMPVVICTCSDVTEFSAKSGRSALLSCSALMPLILADCSARISC